MSQGRITFTIKGVEFGKVPLLIAGPCAIEDKAQILDTARFLSSLGVKVLRGGAFKPRTSPNSFQGLGIKGLEYLKLAAEETGMITVSEVMDTKDIDLLCSMVDILQIGSRNMHNYALLKEVGKRGCPVFLKRGFMASIVEFVSAAEYLAKDGNERIILCERGIRTFESKTRNPLDLSAVPILKKETPYLVFVDPSHGTGRRDIVLPMALSALMAGADGVMIEVHPDPARALSDGLQSLDFHQTREFVQQMNRLIEFIASNGRPSL